MLHSIGHRSPASHVPLLALLLLGPASAAAQAPPEPLVWSASRYAQSTYEAPAAVTVITREEIVRFGYRTLAEVIAAAGGMLTTYDRNYSYLTVRGLSRPGDFNTRVLLMVDGRRLNQPVDDSGGIGTEALIDIDAISRVEIIRGPGSSLYGTNAFHAVVNVVTRRTLDGVELRGQAGSLATLSGSLTAGGRSESDVEGFAALSGYRSDGRDELYFPEFDAPETSDGLAVGRDGDRYGRGFARVSRGDFTAEGFYSYRRKDVPTASYETLFNQGLEQTRDSGAMLSLGYEHAFEDLSRAWAQASYNGADYEGDYPYEDGRFSDFLRSRWLTLEGQYQRFVGRHRVSLGGEARRNTRLEQGGADVFQDERSSTVLAAFVQGELHLVEKLTLHAGGRLDHYDSFGTTLNPRLALVAEPWADTFVKASYGRAFRAPNPYELHYHDGGLTQKPPQRLEPERLTTFEASLERRLRPGLKATATGYRTRITDGIALATDPADELLVFTNADTALARGLELRLEGQHGRLLGRASYAFQSAEEGEDGVRPYGSPRHLAQLAASAAWLEGQLVSSLELRHVGERPASDGSAIEAFTATRLTVLARPRFASRWQLEAHVSNLFDTSFADPGGEEHLQPRLARDGRAAWLALRVRF